jgi:hypothetical protein
MCLKPRIGPVVTRKSEEKMRVINTVAAAATVFLIVAKVFYAFTILYKCDDLSVHSFPQDRLCSQRFKLKVKSQPNTFSASKDLGHCEWLFEISA